MQCKYQVQDRLFCSTGSNSSTALRYLTPDPDPEPEPEPEPEPGSTACSSQLGEELAESLRAYAVLGKKVINGIH